MGVYTTDILLNFNRMILIRGELIKTRSEIVIRYLTLPKGNIVCFNTKHLGFVLDLLSLIGFVTLS
jgi:hypothetical protein